MNVKLYTKFTIYLEQKISSLEKDLPDNMVRTFKNELTKEEFLLLLPQINGNKIQFYKNRLNEFNSLLLSFVMQAFLKPNHVEKALFIFFKKYSQNHDIKVKEEFLDFLVKNYKKELLYMAIEEENLPMIKLLLEYGVDPNIEYNNSPPLHVPNNKNNLLLVKLLLEYGVDPNIEINNLTAYDLAHLDIHSRKLLKESINSEIIKNGCNVLEDFKCEINSDDLSNKPSTSRATRGMGR